MSTDNEDSQPPPPPAPRIFISRVDTYFGKILAQHLGRSLPGESKPESRASEVNDLSELTFLHSKHKEGAFNISASWNIPLNVDEKKAVGKVLVEAPFVPVVEKLVLADNRTEMIKIIEEADICILHIIDDDGQNGIFEDALNVMDIAHYAIREFNKPKTIILLSTTLTWAKTKRLSQENVLEGREPAVSSLDEEEEEDVGFNQEDYKKRRPHPSYRKHLEMEKDLLKLGRDSKALLTTTVVAAGLIYGYGENMLHWMFKEAWQGNKLPVIVPGDGKTHVPMIHARDLCQVIQNICHTKPKSRYIIAVDDGKESLSKVCQAVSRVLSMGQTVLVPAAELLKLAKINQCQYDFLTCDLRMNPSTIKDSMQIDWLAEKGFSQSAGQIIKEFRLVRQLTPIKLVVVGPPFSGKTSMAKRLAQFYHIHYLNAEDIVEEALEALHTIVEAGKVQAFQKSALTDVDDEGPTKAELLQKLLIKMEKGMITKQNPVEEMYVIQFVRERLLSPACQNQGFVLDNFPDTYARAMDLFSRTTAFGEGQNGEEVGHEEGDEEVSARGDIFSKIIPDFVLYLEADEEFLCHRMMLQSDPSPSLLATKAATSTATIEQIFKQRMADHKSSQEDDSSTAANFFHQNQIAAITLPLTKDTDNITGICLKNAISKIGPPRNYGLTVEEKKAIWEEKEKMKIAEKGEREEIKKVKDEEISADRRRHCSEWAAQINHLNEERYRQVVNGAQPIKDYLAEHVLPAVQRGLMAVIKYRPEDPIDFLGQFLIDLTNPLMPASKLDVNEQLLKVARP